MLRFCFVGTASAALTLSPLLAEAQNRNAYGGFNITAATETPYGQVRGWSVVSGQTTEGFAYCAGEFNDAGYHWRLGYDGLQWQVAVPYDPNPSSDEWQGSIEIDGRSGYTAGLSDGTWSYAWLGLRELAQVSAGNHMVLDIGRASIDHGMTGTAAVILKIEECVGVVGAGQNTSASIMATRSAAESQCAPDAVLLGTGLCPSEATNLLQGKAQEPIPLAPGFEHCSWTTAETPFPGGEFLLYSALSCADMPPAQLDFSGGAHKAELTLNGGPYEFHTLTVSHIFAQWETLEQSILENALPQGIAAQYPGCAIYELPWKPGAYVVDTLGPTVSADDGPRASSCGRYGLDQDHTSYWKEAFGFTWFITPEYDLYKSVDVDSFTLVEKDSTGEWRPSGF